MVLQPRHELLYQISSPNREDRPVILDCEAKGDPVPEYRWTKNGQEFSTSGSDDRVAQEPGKGTLTIHRPRDIDEGLYQCRAENSYGISLSNAVYLRRAGIYFPINQVGELTRKRRKLRLHRATYRLSMVGDLNRDNWRGFAVVRSGTAISDNSDSLLWRVSFLNGF